MTKKPNIPEHLHELANELDEKKALDILAESEGGRLLGSALARDAFSAIERMMASYRTIPHAELIGHVAHLEASLNTYKVLRRAKTLRVALEEMLEEQLGAAPEES